MQIKTVTTDKKRFLPLLLLADEQEEMIDRYLERGMLYALYDAGILRSICVVTDEGGGVCELKNLATVPAYQRQGYARALVEHLFAVYRGHYTTMLVGTGDSPLTLPFYERLGFHRSHTIPRFFTDHYDHPIYECGKQLIDMVVLKKDL